MPVIANGNGSTNGKPMTPTPDYDSLISVAETANGNHSNASDTAAPVTFNFTNGGNGEKTIPVPPPMLPKLSLQPEKPLRGASLGKQNRSISVTIGEYRNGTDHRKEPAKFKFLNKSESVDNPPRSEDNVSEQLKNELQMTLSRSNLKKTTEVNDLAFKL